MQKGKTVTEEEFCSAVRKIRAGDKDGLKEIYMAYAKYIYSVIYSITQSKENTEDLTSEMFIKLWDVLDHYKEGNGHKGYLATIARNMAIDFMRRSGREILMSPSEDGEEEKSSNVFDTGGDYDVGRASPPQEQVIEDISIQQALAKLSPDEREVINMKIMADMTFREISEVLGVPMGTITWRYQAALNKLRRCGYE